MGKNESLVSPYLRRPPRKLEDVERAKGLRPEAQPCEPILKPETPAPRERRNKV